MRKVELKMNEKEKYEIIKELVDHNGNKNRASKKLGISKRQINRLIIKYKEKGKAGFVHGNRTRKPVNAFDSTISEDIILLYKNKYYDFNFNHFKKFLEKDEKIFVSYKFKECEEIQQLLEKIFLKISSNYIERKKYINKI